MAEVGHLLMVPAPGTPSAPSFKGVKVTEFLESYSDEWDDAKLKEADKLKRLPRYCSVAVGQYVKTMSESDFSEAV